MDSPVAASLFRTLFRHRRCIPNHATRRTIFTHRPDAKAAAAAGEWQQKSPFLHIDLSEEFKRYPLVTAGQLARRKERPKRVKMLVRDYIDGAPPPSLPPSLPSSPIAAGH